MYSRTPHGRSVLSITYKDTTLGADIPIAPELRAVVNSRTKREGSAISARNILSLPSPTLPFLDGDAAQCHARNNLSLSLPGFPFLDDSAALFHSSGKKRGVVQRNYWTPISNGMISPKLRARVKESSRVNEE
jgi:hypothetical protein